MLSTERRREEGEKQKEEMSPRQWGGIKVCKAPCWSNSSVGVSVMEAVFSPRSTCGCEDECMAEETKNSFCTVGVTIQNA